MNVIDSSIEWECLSMLLSVFCGL